MLSDDEKERIRAEEKAKLRARERVLDEQAHERASSAYRARVAAELMDAQRLRRPRWLVFGAVGVIAILMVGFALTRLNTPPAGLPSSPSDAVGGITDEALLERCQTEVRSRLGEAQLNFPPPEEARDQLSVSSEGKRWDGFVTGSDGVLVEFSCRYTPQTNAIELEIIQR